MLAEGIEGIAVFGCSAPSLQAIRQAVIGQRLHAQPQSDKAISNYLSFFVQSNHVRLLKWRTPSSWLFTVVLSDGFDGSISPDNTDATELEFITPEELRLCYLTSTQDNIRKYFLKVILLSSKLFIPCFCVEMNEFCQVGLWQTGESTTRDTWNTLFQEYFILFIDFQKTQFSELFIPYS